MAHFVKCRSAVIGRNVYSKISFGPNTGHIYPKYLHKTPSSLHSILRHTHSQTASHSTVAATVHIPVIPDQSVAKSPKLHPNSKHGAVNGIYYLTRFYDLLTLPIYTLIQNPKDKIRKDKAPKAERIAPGVNEWCSLIPQSTVTKEVLDLEIDTLEKLFTHAMTQYRNKNCLGSRPILSQGKLQIVNGSPIVKKELGDYKWKTYNEVNELTQNLSQNLVQKLGLKSRDTIAIFADTREEWLITAFAAFKANLALATVFTTLADDGILHAVNETEVTCLVTSEDLMPRCYDLLSKMPLIRNIIYMDRPGSGFRVDENKIPKSVKVQPMSLFLDKPEGGLIDMEAKMGKPGPDDTAIVMYTSGSTGTPKGVILSHFNSISTIMGTADSLDSIHAPRDYERYVGFLPLAHILELTAEAKSLLHGLEIGYGTPLTLTDGSPGLKEGVKGDVTLLKPTIMGGVPLILERIGKSVQEKLKQKGGIAPDLFDFFCRYKMHWIRRGYETPLLDKLVFQKIRDVLGGKVRFMVCGGAPLAAQTEELIRSILCIHLLLGYGLTETAGCASACVAEDLSVGRVGGPINGLTFRLVDWEEGGYRVTDKPYPRGEIYIGGNTVAMGYFKRGASDNEDFFMEDGKRWVKTGDIAEVHEDGVFKIIDRKKDLVKLSTGEFISLGQIESILKTCLVIENICLYANSSLRNPLAVIVPSQIEVQNLAKSLGKTEKSFSNLTQDEDIVKAVLKEIHDHAKLCSLRPNEIPQKIHLSPNVWTPQTGLVTASLKVKRANIYSQFKSEFERLAKN